MAIGSSFASVLYGPGSGVNNIELTYDGFTPANVIFGNWQASPITPQFGGTGASSYTPYTLICAGTTSQGTFQHVVSVGTTGQVLTSNGAAALPTFQSISAAVSSVTGTANEITASPTSGAVVLTIPSTFIAPGTIAATTTSSAGTYFTLPATSATGGAIQINGQNVLHTYGTANTFVGLAGNTTLTAINTTGVGYHSLNMLVSGNGSTAVGYNSLEVLTSGLFNTAVGYDSGVSLVTGQYNVLIGTQAGNNYESNESSNIIVGANVSGTLLENHVMRLGNGTGTGNGQLQAAYISGIHGSPTSLGTTGQVVLCDANDLVGSISSSTAGFVLTSNGAGSPPSFQSIISGVSSVTGTANEITATPTTGAVVLSTPSTFIAPGSIEATTTVTADTYLQLPTTTSTSGALKIGGTIFLHNYGTGGQNTFLGYNAGNFTLTGVDNTFIGYSSDNNLTSGNGNTCIGAADFNQLTSGLRNSALGYQAGQNMTTGSDNTFIGAGAGTQYTSSESSNISIGSSTIGVTGESHTLRIGLNTGNTQVGHLNAAYICGIHGSPTALASTAQVVLNDANNLTGSISSGTAGFVLTSNGAGSPPSFQASTGGVSSVTGTANQVTASPTTGAVVLSTPSTFIAPGSIEATTTVKADTYLLLPTTTTTSGALRINNINVFHTFGTQNTFAGSATGNTTLTGNDDTGFGYNVLSSLTSGSQNTGVGRFALFAVTTGGQNTAVGNGAGDQLVSGSNNTLIGAGAGFNYVGSESSNIILSGGNNGGVAAESHVMRIGNGTGTGAGQLQAAYISGIYNSPTALATTGQVVLIDANNLVGGISSSTAGFVLTSNGAGSPPSFQASSGGVSSVTGTANQITASPTTGAVVLTIPSTFIAPGSIEGTTTVKADTYLQLPTTSSTAGALQINSINVLHTFGTDNTFLGQAAGNTSLTSTDSTCIGFNAGHALTSGIRNTGVGSETLALVTSGQANNCLGVSTGDQMTTGSYNILIGFAAGHDFTSSESSNIIIGHAQTGNIGDSNFLRIGTGTGTGIGQINVAVIAGIYGQPVGVTNSAVLIDNTGILGTTVSSQRFKQNITDMGDRSERVWDLRPVNFSFKKDPTNYMQWGLIAEEVAQILPEIVNHDEEGQPHSVRYHDLPVILLNEMIKLRAKVNELELKLSQAA